MPRVDLLVVGEAFEDLIFAGLPRLPKRGEELRCAQLRVDGRRRRGDHRRGGRPAGRRDRSRQRAQRRGRSLPAHPARTRHQREAAREPHAVTAALSTAGRAELRHLRRRERRSSSRDCCGRCAASVPATCTSRSRRVRSIAGFVSSIVCARAASPRRGTSAGIRRFAARTGLRSPDRADSMSCS